MKNCHGAKNAIIVESSVMRNNWRRRVWRKGRKHVCGKFYLSTLIDEMTGGIIIKRAIIDRRNSHIVSKPHNSYSGQIKTKLFGLIDKVAFGCKCKRCQILKHLSFASSSWIVTNHSAFSFTVVCSHFVFSFWVHSFQPFNLLILNRFKPYTGCFRASGSIQSLITSLIFNFQQ